MDSPTYFSIVLTDKKLVSGHVLSAGIAHVGGWQPTVFDVSSTDHFLVFDELRRFIARFRSRGNVPAFYLVNSQDKWDHDELCDFLVPDFTDIAIPKATLTKMQSREYQDQAFDKTEVGKYSASVTNIDLGKYELGRVALVVLIEKFPADAYKFKVPAVFDSERTLTLESAAIEQLDIDALIKTVDYTYTAMGRRKLIAKVKSPATDIECLHAFKHELEHALYHTDKVSVILSKMLDLERIAKQLNTLEITPKALLGAVPSLEKVSRLYDLFNEVSPLHALSGEIKKRFRNANELCADLFQESRCIDENTVLEDEYRKCLIEIRVSMSRWAEVIEFVSEKDFLNSASILVHKHKYVVPTIDRIDVGHVRAKNLRHPIVETHHRREPFTPNDVDTNLFPMVLYSYNGTGKTTYMKSIALSIVLAQAGYVVPATSYTYAPFEKIFTHLRGRDSVLRGLSTFEMEALEMSSILGRCNRKTLILSEDIMSSDPETNAVMSCAAIRELGNASILLWSTHSTEVLKNVATEHVFHFKVSTHEGNIVFERKIVHGKPQERRAYGIDMARSLGVNPLLLKEPAAAKAKKVSRYNAAKIIDKCEVCGDIASETHHIKFQKDAVGGFVDHRRVHDLSNLVALCDACHHKVHTKQLIIEGYKKTSQGVKLIWRDAPLMDLGSLASAAAEIS